MNPFTEGSIHSFVNIQTSLAFMLTINSRNRLYISKSPLLTFQISNNKHIGWRVPWIFKSFFEKKLISKHINGLCSHNAKGNNKVNASTYYETVQEIIGFSWFDLLWNVTVSLIGLWGLTNFTPMNGFKTFKSWMFWKFDLVYITTYYFEKHGGI